MFDTFTTHLVNPLPVDLNSKDEQSLTIWMVNYAFTRKEVDGTIVSF